MLCERCSKNNAKEYNFTIRSTGEVLRVHIFCIDCIEELSVGGLWDIVPVILHCNCSLILCKECLKNVKEAVDF